MGIWGNVGKVNHDNLVLYPGVVGSLPPHAPRASVPQMNISLIHSYSACSQLYLTTLVLLL